MSLRLRVEKSKHVIKYREKWNKDKTKRIGKVLAEFYVSPVTPSENKKIIDDNTTEEWKSPDKRTKAELTKVVDYLGITYDRVDKIITGWSGVELEDENGNVIDADPPCTRKNKITVFEMQPDVINYVLEEAEAIFKLASSGDKEKEKNFENGQIGTLPPTPQTVTDAD